MTVNVKAEELKATILDYVDDENKTHISSLLEELERQIEDGVFPRAYDEGYEYGYDEGNRAGYNEGYSDGCNDGYNRGGS